MGQNDDAQLRHSPGKIPGATVASLVLLTTSNWLAEPGDSETLSPTDVAAQLTLRARSPFSCSRGPWLFGARRVRRNRTSARRAARQMCYS
jgi:hypothetical protein